MSEEHRSPDEALRDEGLPAEHEDPASEGATRDSVEESDIESFPASDAPGRGGDGDPQIIRERGARQ